MLLSESCTATQALWKSKNDHYEYNNSRLPRLHQQTKYTEISKKWAFSDHHSSNAARQKDIEVLGAKAVISLMEDLSF